MITLKDGDEYLIIKKNGNGEFEIESNKLSHFEIIGVTKYIQVQAILKVDDVVEKSGK